MAKVRVLLSALFMVAFIAAGLAFVSVHLWQGFSEGSVVMHGRVASRVVTLAESPLAFYVGMAVYLALAIFLLWLVIGLSSGIAARLSNRRKSAT